MSSFPNADQRWIPDAKVRDYCLGGVTVKRRSREKFFTGFGFEQAKWEVLRDALMRHTAFAKIEMARQDQYGTTYRAIGPISTPSDRTTVVETYWIIRIDDARPQFTSAIPRGELKSEAPPEK